MAVQESALGQINATKLVTAWKRNDQSPCINLNEQQVMSSRATEADSEGALFIKVCVE